MSSLSIASNTVKSKKVEMFLLKSLGFSNASTECKEYGLETDFDLSDLFLQHKPEDYSHLRNIL